MIFIKYGFNFSSLGRAKFIELQVHLKFQFISVCMCVGLLFAFLSKHWLLQDQEWRLKSCSKGCRPGLLSILPWKKGWTVQPKLEWIIQMLHFPLFHAKVKQGKWKPCIYLCLLLNRDFLIKKKIVKNKKGVKSQGYFS